MSYVQVARGNVATAFGSVSSQPAYNHSSTPPHSALSLDASPSAQLQLDLQAEIHKLRGQVVEARAVEREVVSDLLVAQADVKRLESENARLRGEVEILRSRSAELESENRALSGSQQQQQQSVSRTTSAAHMQQQQQAAAAVMRAMEKSDERSSVAERMQTARQLELLRQQVRLQEHEIARLVEAERSAQAMRKELDSFKRVLDDKEQQLAEANTGLARAKRSAEYREGLFEKTVQGLQAQIAALKARADNVEREHASELDALRAHGLDQLERAKRINEDEMNSLRVQHEVAMTVEIERLRRELSRSEHANAEAALRQRDDELEAWREAHREIADASGARMEEVKLQMQLAVAEIEQRAQQTIANLEAELSEARDMVRQAQEGESAARIELADVNDRSSKAAVRAERRISQLTTANQQLFVRYVEELRRAEFLLAQHHSDAALRLTLQRMRAEISTLRIEMGNTKHKLVSFVRESESFVSEVSLVLRSQAALAEASSRGARRGAPSAQQQQQQQQQAVPDGETARRTAAALQIVDEIVTQQRQLTVDNGEIGARLTSMLREYDAVLAEVRVQSEVMERDMLDKFEAAVNDLRMRGAQERGDYEARIVVQNDEIAFLNKRIEELTARLEQAGGEVQARDNLVHQANGVAQQHEETAVMLEDRLQAVTAEYDALREMLGAVDALVTDFGLELAAAAPPPSSTTIGSAGAVPSLTATRSRSRITSPRAAQAVPLPDKLRASLDHARKLMSALRVDSDARGSHVVDLEALLQRADEDRERLRIERDSMGDRLADLAAHVRQLASESEGVQRVQRTLLDDAAAISAMLGEALRTAQASESGWQESVEAGRQLWGKLQNAEREMQVYRESLANVDRASRRRMEQLEAASATVAQLRKQIVANLGAVEATGSVLGNSRVVAGPGTRDNAAFTEEASRLHTILVRLQEDIARMNGPMNEAERAETQRLATTLHELHADVARKQAAESARTHDWVERTNEFLRDVAAQVESTEALVRARSREYADSLARAQDELAELRTQNADAAEKNASLLAENREFERVNREMHREMEAMQRALTETREAYERDVGTARSDLQAARAEAARLADTTRAATTERDDLQHSLRLARAEIDGLLRQQQDSEQRSTRNTSQLEHELESVRAELVAALDKVRALEDARHQTERGTARMRDDAERAVRESQQLFKERDEAVRLHADLARQVHAWTQKFCIDVGLPLHDSDVLRSLAAAHERTLKIVEQTKNREAEAVQLERENGALRHEIETLQHELVESNTRGDELARHVQSMGGAVREREATLGETARQMARAAEQVSAARSLAEQVLDGKLRVVRQFDEFKDELSSIRQQLATERTELDALLVGAAGMQKQATGMHELWTGEQGATSSTGSAGSGGGGALGRLASMHDAVRELAVHSRENERAAGALQQHLGALQAHAANHQTAAVRAQDSAEAVRQECQAVLNAREREMQDMRRYSEALRNDLQLAQAQLNEVGPRLQAALRDNEALQVQLAHHKAQLERLAEEHDRSVREGIEREQALREQLARTDHELRDLQARAADKTELQMEQQRRAQGERELEQLRAQLAAITERERHVSQQLTESRDSATNLASKLADLQAHISSLEAAKDADERRHKVAVADLQRQVSERETQLSDTVANAKQARTREAKQDVATVAKLRQVVDTLREEAADMATRAQTFEDQIATLRAQLSKEVAAKEAIGQQVSELAEFVQRSSAKADAIHAEEAQATTKQIDDLSAAMAAMKAERDRLQRENLELSDRLTETETRLRESRARSDSNEQIKRRTEGLQSDLANAFQRLQSQPGTTSPRSSTAAAATGAGGGGGSSTGAASGSAASASAATLAMRSALAGVRARRETHAGAP